MRDPAAAVPALLNDLYDQVTDARDWPGFLGKFAALFRSDTATIRLTDLEDPVVYHSYVCGFHSGINDYYESEAVGLDPFQEPLNTSPVGAALTSHSLLGDQDFEKTDHYQFVFRPNGNFYAMGAQFERRNGTGLHVGLHRPRQTGPYSSEETHALELFSPHLRRVSRLSRLMAELNQSLTESRQALDRLAFGVWQMNEQLQIQWLNHTAEEALRAGTYNLSLRDSQLLGCSPKHAAAIRASAQQLFRGESRAQTLRLSEAGACLVMTLGHHSPAGFRIGDSPTPSILCFLLDPARPAQLHESQLRTLYELTPAELRLASLLVTGMDVSEASAVLQISPNTGRTQLKSIMQKTGVNRQTRLQRKLLIGATTLRHSGD